MLLIISIIPVAIAEENNGTTIDTTVNAEVDAETQAEIETMDTKLGSGMRLLQLERAITRQMLRGVEVIKIIDEKVASGELVLDDIAKEQVAQAKEIVSVDFPQLITELQTINPQDGEAAKKFIAVKDDAKQLTQEFAKLLLANTGIFHSREDILAMAREAAKNVDRTELKELNQKIIEIRRQFNADRANTILARVGSADPALVEKIKTGQINFGQIRQEIAKRITSLPPEERRAAVQKVREDNTKRAVFREDTVKEHRSGKLERRSNITANMSIRKQTRSDIAEGKGRTKRAENLQERSDKFSKWSQNLDKRSGRLVGNNS